MIKEKEKYNIDVSKVGVNDDKINMDNKLLYDKLKDKHIKDGGKHPDAYAITEVIRKSIVDKTYKVYRGGGYEQNTDNPIKICDVVVWFNWGGDAFFQLCVDNRDGDFCILVSSNDKCEFLEKMY